MQPQSDTLQSLTSIGTALILTGAILFGAFYFLTGENTANGTLYVSAAGQNPVPALYTYSVPNLTEEAPPFSSYTEVAGIKQREIMRSIVSSNTGVIAYLGKSGRGWEVFVVRNSITNQLTFTNTVKRDLRWSSDFKTLLYSELPIDSSLNGRNRLEDWQVVRLELTGEQDELGSGIRPWGLSNGSVISLTSSGIGMLGNSSNEVSTPLISSALFITDTPVAMSLDGARIAWVNPSDRSLQIFERSLQGTYTPILIIPGVSATSLAFNRAGTLLITASGGEGGTDIRVVDIRRSNMKLIGTIPGIAEITDWLPKN